MTRNVTHEITLREEEACDVSSATFHVFGKEGAKTSGPASDPSPLARAVACSHVWPGKPRPKTTPIRLGHQVRLGRHTSPFGESADRRGGAQCGRSGRVQRRIARRAWLFSENPLCPIPCFRSRIHPVHSRGLVIKGIDGLKSTVRPFGLNQPLITVTRMT